MSTEYTGGTEARHTAEAFRDDWLWLVGVGCCVDRRRGCGHPRSGRFGNPGRQGPGRVWLSWRTSFRSCNRQDAQLGSASSGACCSGVLAMVGGALIYMDPFAGVMAITLLIAIIFAVHGLTQIAFAVRVRGPVGMALVPGLGLHRLGCERAAGDEVALRPLVHPATIAGVSLFVGGCAYVAMALASRKAVAPA